MRWNKKGDSSKDKPPDVYVASVDAETSTGGGVRQTLSTVFNWNVIQNVANCQNLVLSHTLSRCNQHPQCNTNPAQTQTQLHSVRLNALAIAKAAIAAYDAAKLAGDDDALNDAYDIYLAYWPEAFGVTL